MSCKLPLARIDTIDAAQRRSGNHYIWNKKCAQR